MTSRHSALALQAATAGDLLREWRGLRGKSQLELALDAGISQRHVSFVETGRSTPSRQMIVDLAHALNIPLRERNAMLEAAGFAAIYREEPLDAAAMRSVGRAVTRILRLHEPFPAMALDRTWNVVEMNRAAPAFFGRFVDLERRPRPRNLLHLVFDPEGLRPFLLRWEETARSLLQRVRREAVGGALDEKARALLDVLMAYPGAPQDSRPMATGDGMPMIPMGFRTPDGTLELFSMVTTVGAPQTVTSQEIRLETMFPADEAMESAFLDFVGAPDPKS